LVEPLLHFAVPFAVFTALGVKPKRAFLLSLFALLPDLDILINIHRFCSHSLIPLLAITIPLILIAVKFNFQRMARTFLSKPNVGYLFRWLRAIT